jgi:hypothetical protein
MLAVISIGYTIKETRATPIPARTAMNAREERGLIIAAVCKLRREGVDWFVPSQSAAERVYRVNVESDSCTCPDHQETGFKCKHVYAAEFTMRRHSQWTAAEITRPQQAARRVARN